MGLEDKSRNLCMDPFMKQPGGRGSRVLRPLLPKMAAPRVAWPSSGCPPKTSETPLVIRRRPESQPRDP